jgi:hypothetical protein
MRNLQELHISADADKTIYYYYWEYIHVRRLFVSLTRANHKIFADPSSPVHFLEVAGSNTHLEELFVTYFCSAGCPTSCPDDENIKTWITRPSAPSRPRIHYRRVWAMNPDHEEETPPLPPGPADDNYINQLSREEEQI